MGTGPYLGHSVLGDRDGHHSSSPSDPGDSCCHSGEDGASAYPDSKLMAVPPSQFWARCIPSAPKGNRSYPHWSLGMVAPFPSFEKTGCPFHPTLGMVSNFPHRGQGLLPTSSAPSDGHPCLLHLHPSRDVLLPKLKWSKITLLAVVPRQISFVPVASLG